MDKGKKSIKTALLNNAIFLCDETLVVVAGPALSTDVAYNGDFSFNNGYKCQ
jgi:hypothetical protein